MDFSAAGEKSFFHRGRGRVDIDKDSPDLSDNQSTSNANEMKKCEESQLHGWYSQRQFEELGCYFIYLDEAGVVK